jgi:hypothetical protein
LSRYAREQRLTEVLIGELLGKPTPGKPRHGVTRLHEKHAHDFRRLAANGDPVRELVDAGVVDRYTRTGSRSSRAISTSSKRGVQKRRARF